MITSRNNSSDRDSGIGGFRDLGIADSGIEAPVEFPWGSPIPRGKDCEKH